ncbi:MAG TPA: hypothetical protein VMA31_08680 [Bryobacteraceae bacterium]|nr:hypothetical protein [Bryobacteraceae bacterium]
MGTRKEMNMASPGPAPWPQEEAEAERLFENGTRAVPAKAVPEAVRLNFNVSPSVAEEVRTLAGDLDLSMTQLFRYAFGILKLAANEAKRKRKLVIADENGTPLREIVLPGIGE